MKLERYRSTKSFWNFPCAHRQWRHHGHCSLVHGYSRSFHFLFESMTGELDPTGFVFDFSGLKEVKVWLDEHFDHTLLLNSDDPLLPEFIRLEGMGACKVIVAPYGVSMEGTAKWLHDYWAPRIAELTNGAVALIQVEVRENEKNSGIYKVETI